MKMRLVPVMLALSAVVMSLAWIGHLRFEKEWSFWMALAASWSLVLPEYALNTAATRWGHDKYTGAQMASVHLSSGVVCIALVSRFVLGEQFVLSQFIGFTLMILSIMLILSRPAQNATSTSTMRLEAVDRTQ